MAKIYIMVLGPLFFAALMLAGWSAKQIENNPAQARKGLLLAALIAGIPLITLMVLAYKSYGV